MIISQIGDFMLALALSLVMNSAVANSMYDLPAVEAPTASTKVHVTKTTMLIANQELKLSDRASGDTCYLGELFSTFGTEGQILEAGSVLNLSTVTALDGESSALLGLWSDNSGNLRLRWLYYDATYMQFKVEEMKWGFGFFLIAGIPLIVLWPIEIIAVDFRIRTKYRKWYNRNQRIFNNIRKTRPTAEDRIVVLFGNGHMPLLKH